jgi:N-methylhydantoinase B/oxoprolinase/acetone carboxylase alpha subunit
VISDSLASLKSMIEVCAEKIDFQIRKARIAVNLSENLQFLIAISTNHTKLIAQTAIFNQSP